MKRVFLSLILSILSVSPAWAAPLIAPPTIKIVNIVSAGNTYTAWTSDTLPLRTDWVSYENIVAADEGNPYTTAKFLIANTAHPNTFTANSFYQSVMPINGVASEFFSPCTGQSVNNGVFYLGTTLPAGVVVPVRRKTWKDIR